MLLQTLGNILTNEIGRIKFGVHFEDKTLNRWTQPMDATNGPPNFQYLSQIRLRVTGLEFCSVILLFHHTFDQMQSLIHQKLDICGQIEGFFGFE